MTAATERPVGASSRIETVAGAVAPFFAPDLSVDAYAWLCLLVFSAAFVPGLVLSFRYLRRLQKSGV